VVIKPDDEFTGRHGVICGLTTDGWLVIQMEAVRGPGWEITFHPQDLELAPRDWKSA
jgi:hypothetical protein